MAIYRVMSHGSFGKWYKIQRKFLWFWTNVDRFFDTLTEANSEVARLRDQDKEQSK